MAVRPRLVLGLVVEERRVWQVTSDIWVGKGMFIETVVLGGGEKHLNIFFLQIIT